MPMSRKEEAKSRFICNGIITCWKRCGELCTFEKVSALKNIPSSPVGDNSRTLPPRTYYVLWIGLCFLHSYSRGCKVTRTVHSSCGLCLFVKSKNKKDIIWSRVSADLLHERSQPWLRTVSPAAGRGLNPNAGPVLWFDLFLPYEWKLHVWICNP